MTTVTLMCFIYRVYNNGEKTSEEKIILSWTEALMLPVSILKKLVAKLERIIEETNKCCFKINSRFS